MCVGKIGVKPKINSLLAEKFSYNRIDDLNLLDETFSFDRDGYDRYSKFF